MTEPAKPGIFDRLRARFGWLDHVIRAYQRFDATQRRLLTQPV